MHRHEGARPDVFQAGEERWMAGGMQAAVKEAIGAGSPNGAALQSVWLEPPLAVYVKIDAARDRPASGIWCCSTEGGPQLHRARPANKTSTSSPCGSAYPKSPATRAQAP